MEGFHEKVEDRKQLKQFDTTVKGKMIQLGEEKLVVNPRLTGAKVGDFRWANLIKWWWEE